MVEMVVDEGLDIPLSGSGCLASGGGPTAGVVYY
jgi:hypothetical protein